MEQQLRITRRRSHPPGAAWPTAPAAATTRGGSALPQLSAVVRAVATEAPLGAPVAQAEAVESLVRIRVLQPARQRRLQVGRLAQPVPKWPDRRRHTGKVWHGPLASVLIPRLQKAHAASRAAGHCKQPIGRRGGGTRIGHHQRAIAFIGRGCSRRRLCSSELASRLRSAWLVRWCSAQCERASARIVNHARGTRFGRIVLWPTLEPLAALSSERLLPIRHSGRSRLLFGRRTRRCSATGEWVHP